MALLFEVGGILISMVSSCVLPFFIVSVFFLSWQLSLSNFMSYCITALSALHIVPFIMYK